MSLQYFREQLDEALKKLIEQGFTEDDVYIYFTSSTDYDNDTALSVQLTASRRETDDEFNARLAQEEADRKRLEEAARKKAELQAKAKQDKEYQEYLKLKAKYEPKT